LDGWIGVVVSLEDFGGEGASSFFSSVVGDGVSFSSVLISVLICCNVSVVSFGVDDSFNLVSPSLLLLVVDISVVMILGGGA